MYQALYRKWRPLCFADVIGQQHITDTLRAQLRTGKLGHAYLFTGTRGTGKTTCAKILARAVNCQAPAEGEPCGVCAACRGILDGTVLDVTEIDAASNNGVDNIRQLCDETRYTPAQVKKRVFIIDEVHMLSIGAFNALLKTLEEPPAHVLFILATTELHKVPVTIVSRCQRFDFRRIGVDEVAHRLREVAEHEDIALTEGAAQLLARLSDGAMRDALSMLDRAAAQGAVDEQTVAATLGILGEGDALLLAQSCKQGALAQAIGLIGQYYELGRDLAGVYNQFLALIRDALLVKTARSEVSALLSPAYSVETLVQLCDGLAASTLLAWSRIIGEALDRMRSAANRRIEAELCAVRLCTFQPQAYDTLDGRLQALEEKLAHGIPMATAPAANHMLSGDTAPVQGDGPPPPDDRDIPDWAAEQVHEGMGDTIQESAAKQPAMRPWQHWDALRAALEGKIGPSKRYNLRYVHAFEQNDMLILLCEDEVAEQGMREELDTIRAQVHKLTGKERTVKVRLEQSGQKDIKNPALDGLMGQAQARGIRVEQGIEAGSIPWD